MTKGIAKLHVTTELIESLLCLPEGVKITDASFHKDAYFSYVEFVVVGDELPTLDETNGEIKLGNMLIHTRYVSEPYKSEFQVEDKTVASWRKED